MRLGQAAALAAALGTAAASAHEGMHPPAGLLEGMGQIVSNLGHLSAVAALGPLGALEGPDAAWDMQLALPAGLAAGVLAGALWPGVDSAAAAALAASAAVALLATAAPHLPRRLPPLVALATATLHGIWAVLAHQPAVSLPAFAAGAAAAGTLVYALVAWPGLELRAHWQRIALRVAGSWIAAIALLALGAAVARG